ncbi:MAG: DUF2058 family protein [Granulosicoccus sp.]
MSDSLKDQLLRAGFEATKPVKRLKSKKTHAKQIRSPAKVGSSTRFSPATLSPRKDRSNRAGATGKSGKPKKPPIIRRTSNARFSSPPDAVDATEQSLKAKVQTLIEANEIKDSKGETLYQYVLGSRVQELQVDENTRQRLLVGELTVTQLNGTARIVTRAASEQILALNPQWAMARLVTDENHAEPNNDYKDFPIPDDLQW